MGNSEEENRHKEKIDMINAISEDWKKKRQIEEYIEKNNLEKYRAEINLRMTQIRNTHEEKIEELNNKHEEEMQRLNNQRKNDSEKNENNKLQMIKNHELNMQKLSDDRKEKEDMNIRKTEELHLKYKNEEEKASYKHEENIKKINEKSNLDNKQENNRHSEEMERIKNEQLKIEKDAEISRDKSKNEMQEKIHQFEEKIQINKQNHEILLKQLEKEKIQITEDAKLKSTEAINQHNLKFQNDKYNFEQKILETKTKNEEQKLSAQQNHEEKMLAMKIAHEEKMSQMDKQNQINQCLLMMMSKGMINPAMMMNQQMVMKPEPKKENGQNEYNEKISQNPDLNNTNQQFNPLMNMMSMMFNQNS